MKKTIVLCSFACFLSFSFIQPPFSGPGTSLDQETTFDWLLGQWKRTNDQEGLQTFEYWEKLNDTEYKAAGYTLKAEDTVWQESIQLQKSGDVWNFKVTGKGEKKSTIFKLTKLELESFTCENKTNEFPKKIRYAKVEKGLNAVISGDGKVILFQFAKVSQ